MKALVLEDDMRLIFGGMPIPNPCDDQVLLKVKAIGIRAGRWLLARL